MVENEENDNVQQVAVAKSNVVLEQPKLIRKFEINLYNEDVNDNTGETQLVYAPSEKPIIISAANKNELQEALAVYKNCGQVPKIVREIDPPTKEDLAKFAKKLKAYDDYKKGKITAEEAMQSDSACQIPSQHTEDYINDEQPTQLSVQQTSKRKLQPIAPKASEKQPPRYFKVGDIELKEDNGKMYQKQFITLTDVEASNIRVVDNKTNRVLNLNGKHIEMKKWILVENQSNSEQETLEENLK